jgi:hypothetical protein
MRTLFDSSSGSAASGAAKRPSHHLQAAAPFWPFAAEQLVNLVQSSVADALAGVEIQAKKAV